MSIHSRRDFLLKTGQGLGGAALAGLIPGVGAFTAAHAADLVDPLAPKQPHLPAKVKSVIWLHMNGAPSTLDLYDYKPELVKLAGTEVPASFLKGIKTSTQGGSASCSHRIAAGSSMATAAPGSPTSCPTSRSTPTSSHSSSRA
jgi:hypothetical protein